MMCIFAFLCKNCEIIPKIPDFCLFSAMTWEALPVKKVRILTIHFGVNHGSVLQAWCREGYALCCTGSTGASGEKLSCPDVKPS